MSSEKLQIFDKSRHVVGKIVRFLDPLSSSSFTFNKLSQSTIDSVYRALSIDIVCKTLNRAYLDS